MPRLGSTLLSLALAGAITLAAYTDPVLVGAAVALVQVLIALAPRAVGPSGRSIRSPHFVAALSGGLVATAITLAPDLLNGADGTSPDVVGATDSGMLAGILPAIAIAVSVFVALIAQMLRKDGRPDLVPSTAYAVTLGAFAALCAGWIGAAQSLGDAEAVAVGAAGLAAGLLVWLVPLDRFVCASFAVVAGAAAGAAVTLLVDSSLTWVFGVTIGSATALFAVLGQVLGRAWSRGRTHASAGWGFPGAMSIALAAPLVYVGGQLVGAPGL
ncbi:hypothetical protein ASE12_15525 [Aeromicrobium sp. Root236]|uniref:hypothetical protein n=1 Tax=Aeromicrobium sp. Root236 TaxID=1736498 RepID=UPI0006FA63A1|nr:hypothetical protein [Aeromicrobium sp. Root236]KRC66041.1 hypothetical protein ASE12_15525 [Aeromicrobium sp. Root236]